MQVGQPKTKQRQMPVLMHKNITLQGGNIMIRVEPRSRKGASGNGHATNSIKKELQSLLGKVNYMSSILPMTAEVCEPLWKLTSVKTKWSWNGMFQDLYEKAKNIIKQNTCMKFFDASKPLYLEAESSGINLETGLFQVRDNMNCR